MLETVFTKSSELAVFGPAAHDKAVLVMPYTDGEQAERAADMLVRRAQSDALLLLVEDDLRLGFIQVVNLVYTRSRSQYFGYLAQDAYPGEGWLKCALYTLDSSGAGLLAFNDGRFWGTLAVFGLARRSFVTSLYHNVLFFPGYKRHFADTELSSLASERGAMVFNESCLLVEVDYDKHVKRNDPEDDALFRQRARSGFGGLGTPFEPE